ncbi:putative peroxisome targeting signal 1 receptor [Trypanosoma theileri]|uniref:Putative peroxisome targeting signal 1 receptor n=1 Tax=Trypanosoma theileri TaxID=67003 RepID=A0A1X0NWH5_9TRYP|nr:putative peroxisome targeting signal 1 receptor [Trypanosoma theileri]ORC89054.1 putative peroxisome targeting signal 1 receptor [Trypanosoma theileri]
MVLSPSSSLSKEETLFRNKRQRQQGKHDASNPLVDSSCMSDSLSLSVIALRRSLLCPPCRVHDGVTAKNTLLQYVVLPGFFKSQSKRVKVSSTQRIQVPPSTTCCKASLRTLLIKALDGARQSIGAVDEISSDSLLIVAFAEMTTPTSRHDNSINSSCNNSPFSSSFVNGGVSTALRPTQRLEVVGLCVARELSMAYRLHCRKTPISISLSSSLVSTSESSLTTTTTTTTILGGSTSAPCTASNENNENHWVDGTTEVGDMWCTGSSFCGIQFFWVSNAHRRSGIATMLVELARQNVSYGFEIPAEQVAFSEPTVYGKIFARKYTGRPDFLIF